jgi:predicted nucleotidyltransferase component of viral defense system
MSRYPSAEAFRQALETRLAQRSLETGVDLGRLRRRVVTERVLVRLDAATPSGWVLKGGTAMELRLPDHARSTLDVDLVARTQTAGDGVIDRQLREALDHDVEGDRFSFEVAAPRTLQPGGEDDPTQVLRYTLSCRLAGRRFGEQRLDVSPRSAEIGETERLPIPNSLAFDGFPDHAFETVGAAQHVAEKLHALTRDYGRENTRTRDLVDLVLFIRSGQVTPGSVGPAVGRVFRERGSHSVPIDLADPPPSWAAPYARLARELDLDVGTVPAAMALLRDFWALARPTTTSEGPA